MSPELLISSIVFLTLTVVSNSACEAVLDPVVRLADVAPLIACWPDKKRNPYLACERYSMVSNMGVVSRCLYSLFILTGTVTGHVVGHLPREHLIDDPLHM